MAKKKRRLTLNKNYKQQKSALAERDRIIASAAANKQRDAEEQRQREEAAAVYLRPAREEAQR